MKNNFIDNSLYLKQHGIKGQKWYVRRFQNKDGSLTPEGRARYGSNIKRKTDKDDKSELMEIRAMEYRDKKETKLSEEYFTKKEKAVYEKLGIPIDFLEMDINSGRIKRKDGREFEGTYKGKTRSYEYLDDIADDYDYFNSKNKDENKFSIIWDNPGATTLNSTFKEPLDSPAHFWNYMDENYSKKYEELTKDIDKKTLKKEAEKYSDLAVIELEKDFYKREVIERGQTAKAELEPYKKESSKDKREKAAYSVLYKHPEYFTNSTGKWFYEGKEMSLGQLIKVLAKSDFIDEYV